MNRDGRKLLKLSTVLLFTFTAVIALCAFSAQAENIDPGSMGCKYVWAENIGWINFKPSMGPGVTVTDTAVTGMAWGENIGWINLSPANYGGVVNKDRTGNLEGYAWGENVGWINFKPENGGVHIGSDGKFTGQAWGENIGWINFSAANSCVKTAWLGAQADTTPPVISGTPSNIVAEATSAAGAVVTYSLPTANDAVDGAVSVSCAPSSGSTFALGSTTVSCQASDNAGNKATSSFTVTVQDTTLPTIAAHADVTATATSYSAVVNYDPPTATDLVDGSVPVSCVPASGSSFNVGTTVVNCSATDAHGNTAHSAFNVNVIVTYNWTGFFQPVDNAPVLNAVKAGSAVPVKFSLSGYQGLDIMAQGSPGSATIPCASTATVDNLTETVTAGTSGLTYDAAADQYIYVWKTDTRWAGTCRQLNVTLKDGIPHVANFKFTK